MNLNIILAAITFFSGVTHVTTNKIIQIEKQKEIETLEAKVSHYQSVASETKEAPVYAVHDTVTVFRDTGSTRSVYPKAILRKLPQCKDSVYLAGNPALRNGVYRFPIARTEGKLNDSVEVKIDAHKK